MSQYLLHRQALKNGTKASEPPKEKKPIAKVSEKKKLQNKEEKPQRDELTAWFKHIEVKEFGGGGCNCWECGEFIHYAFARAAIAHVLPKRDNQFPSVKTHADNYLILGAGCGCHNRYDRTWEDAAQMKVFPLAVERFNKIYPSIAAKERKNIPDILMQELEPSILIATPAEDGVILIEKA